MKTSIADLIASLTNTDDAVRGPAWQGAAAFGAEAVKPLAGVMVHPDFEIARSARRALWVVVRHAGRPAAAKEAQAVTKELLALLAGSPPGVQRELVWMLSEIAGDDAIGPMSALLANPTLRQDALSALQRLPGVKVTRALSFAFGNVPEDFKSAVADALRNRGETVKGYPSQKLVPTRGTQVTMATGQ